VLFSSISTRASIGVTYMTLSGDCCVVLHTARESWLAVVAQATTAALLWRVLRPSGVTSFVNVLSGNLVQVGRMRSPGVRCGRGSRVRCYASAAGV